jgi:hypothetical protein
MLVSGTSGNSPFDRAASVAQQLTASMRQEFEQLGHDLQSGNLKAAQSDFATLQQSGPLSKPTAAAAPGAPSSPASQDSNSVSQAFSQLAQDLRTGNMTAARQDYTTLQRDMQKARPGLLQHLQTLSNGVSTVEGLLGQAVPGLPGGYISAALQAYGLLAPSLPGSGSATNLGGGTQSAYAPLSVTA